ncbi:hypothetical protein F5B20DRAFT_545096 [Whalleya microplaca]|nr:hypothetical protein F5B20DRAFT_545096 [Whalleya microplaca]
MSNRRTIILAVMPCNVDIVTQEILKLAEVADPDGVRTMGVLTKPDLATESATQQAALELVLGKRNVLNLGYCVIKNRSADDNTSTMVDRLAAEKAFFMGPAWLPVADRCGIEALQVRLRDLLMGISKREYPHVKAEIEGRLHQCRADLETMGPSRADQNSQRLYLAKIASRFQSTTQRALNGYYAGDQIIKSDPTLKLATKMIKLNETISYLIRKVGHKRQFSPSKEEKDKIDFLCSIDDSFDVPSMEYSELSDITVEDEYECPEPMKGPIIDHVKEVFQANRGPEVGTFNGSILATLFEEQTEKWEPLVLFHTSNAIKLVHDYISRLLTRICPEEQVRYQLWNTLLVDKLRDAYRQALSQARFVLAVEREARPATYNHSFNNRLQRKRREQVAKDAETMATTARKGDDELYVPLSKLIDYAADKEDVQQLCEDIVDTLNSYYEVSRDRFIDTICRQVVNRFLLDGDESPLRILSPELAITLDPDQLELIAGEDPSTKQQRQVLSRQIESLATAAKVLRG